MNTNNIYIVFILYCGITGVVPEQPSGYRFVVDIVTCTISAVALCLRFGYFNSLSTGERNLLTNLLQMYSVTVSLLILRIAVNSLLMNILHKQMAALAESFPETTCSFLSPVLFMTPIFTTMAELQVVKLILILKPEVFMTFDHDRALVVCIIMIFVTTGINITELLFSNGNFCTPIMKEKILKLISLSGNSKFNPSAYGGLTNSVLVLFILIAEIIIQISYKDIWAFLKNKVSRSRKVSANPQESVQGVPTDKRLGRLTDDDHKAGPSRISPNIQPMPNKENGRVIQHEKNKENVYVIDMKEYDKGIKVQSTTAKNINVCSTSNENLAIIKEDKVSMYNKQINSKIITENVNLDQSQQFRAQTKFLYRDGKNFGDRGWVSLQCDNEEQDNLEEKNQVGAASQNTLEWKCTVANLEVQGSKYQKKKIAWQNDIEGAPTGMKTTALDQDIGHNTGHQNERTTAPLYDSASLSLVFLISIALFFMVFVTVRKVENFLVLSKFLYYLLDFLGRINYQALTLVGIIVNDNLRNYCFRKIDQIFE